MISVRFRQAIQPLAVAQYILDITLVLRDLQIAPEKFAFMIEDKFKVESETPGDKQLCGNEAGQKLISFCQEGNALVSSNNTEANHGHHQMVNEIMLLYSLGQDGAVSKNKTSDLGSDLWQLTIRRLELKFPIRSLVSQNIWSPLRSTFGNCSPHTVNPCISNQTWEENSVSAFGCYILLKVLSFCTWQ